jgi:hypothetical protein
MTNNQSVVVVPFPIPYSLFPIPDIDPERLCPLLVAALFAAEQPRRQLGDASA